MVVPVEEIESLQVPHRLQTYHAKAQVGVPHAYSQSRDIFYHTPASKHGVFTMLEAESPFIDDLIIEGKGHKLMISSGHNCVRGQPKCSWISFPEWEPLPI